MMLFIIILSLCATNFCFGQTLDNFNLQKRVEYDSQGKLTYFPKAVSGTVVRKGEFQNFVSIQTKTGNHLCGGVMLDFDFIITTASCLTKTRNRVPYDVSELQVMNDALQNETVKYVNQIFLHPDFDSTTLNNDVAMLNIQAFKWSNDIEMLTALDKPSNDVECKVIGWGKSDESEPFLQKISGSIVENNVCNSKYSYNSSNKFCVQGQNGACLEEPGSGLICDEELVGILSFGNGCSRNDQNQIVYTDLSKYNIWIDEVFRTAITKKALGPESTISTQTTPKPIMTTPSIATTLQTVKPQTSGQTTEKINLSQTSSLQNEVNGQWVYQVVMDTCQLSFVTCEPVWSDSLYNVQCKRGYFPYGCFHIVKNFVKETVEDTGRNIGKSVKESASNRLLKFKTYLKQKPLDKVQKAVENIFKTEQKSRIGLTATPNTNNSQDPVILTPFNQWFQRIFCLPVLQFKHYNNFPQHFQWKSDCERFQQEFEQPLIQSANRGMFERTTDSKIYFPDD